MSNDTANEIKTDKKPFRAPRWVRRMRAKFAFLIDWKGHLRALAHFLVIALAFVALNWIFSPDDPGWLKLNPSPWVLLPLYLGFQFGFVWGVATGLLQVGTRLMIAEMSEAQVALNGSEHFLLWSMVLTGAMGGFVRGVLNRQEEQKSIALRDSLQSSELLKSQVALLKHNEHELSNVMVSQGMEESSLTLSLRNVVKQNEDVSDRDEAFLNLLRDRCGVQSAAIYFSANEGKTIRTAYSENNGEFPESMPKTPMIKHAERTGEIVTQRWFWEPFEPSSSETIDDRYLAVIAHQFGLDFRVLVISQMAFEKIHWENLWKLEAAFRWFEDTIQTGKIDEYPIQWKKSDLKIAEPEPTVPTEEQAKAQPQPVQPQPVQPQPVQPQPVQPQPVQPQPVQPQPVQPQPVAIAPEPLPIEPQPELIEEYDPIAELEEEIEPLYNPVGLEPTTSELVVEQKELEEIVSIEQFSNTNTLTGRPILEPAEFKQRLAECRRTELESQTRYRLIIFVPDPQETPERSEHFAISLSEVSAPTDDLSRIPSEGGRYVYGLITAADNNEFAEQYAAVLLKRVSDLKLRFFVLNLDDPALSAFEN